MGNFQSKTTTKKLKEFQKEWQEKIEGKLRNKHNKESYNE